MVTPAALVKVLLAAASLAAGEPAPTPSPLSPTPQALNAVSATPRARAAVGSKPRSLSPSAATLDLPLLPPRPEEPKLTQAVPWEYVTVVTLLSAPFTALWCGLVAAVVETIAQHGRFPPKFSSSQYVDVGAVAGTASLGIALFSVSWGGHAPSPRAPGAGVPAAAKAALGGPRG